MDTGGSSTGKIGSGPKTRVCYICGRQYGLSSFNIHVPQCKELWIKREEKKDPKERKPVPLDPLLQSQSASDNKPASVSENHVNDNRSENGGMSLEEINRISSEAFNTSALNRCEYCGRTFLPEKLVIHNRSCTAEHPARRVTDAVNRGKSHQSPTTESISNNDDRIKSSLPANRTSGGIKSKRSVNIVEENGLNDDSDKDSAAGSAGRSFLRSPIRSSRQPKNVAATADSGDISLEISEDMSKDDVFAAIQQRLSVLETTAVTVLQGIQQTKMLLEQFANK